MRRDRARLALLGPDTGERRETVADVDGTSADVTVGLDAEMRETVANADRTGERWVAE